MPETLAIGAYSEADRRGLAEAYGISAPLSLPDALDLPEAERAEVRAIAYKGHARFGAPEMAAFPRLGLVANYGVGFDAIDIAEAAARGIAVSNTPDVLNDDVADLAVALLLAQMRCLRQGEAHIRAGHWATGVDFALNRSLTGARIGILGLGRIGREIADRLAAFKTELHYWSRREKPVPAGWVRQTDPVALARAVDVLVVAVVGGAETEGIVSAEVLDALGADGVLVNISRGSTVDEAALLERLEEGRLAGAGLDVFRGEPRIDPRFLALDTVALQPHQGSGTHATRAAMGRLQRDNIAAFLAGRPLITPVTQPGRAAE
ncbi:NAD(P)-dependent oxidoreductase [Roseivivax sp. CAU 1761]